MTILGSLLGVLVLGGWMFVRVRSIIQEMQVEQAHMTEE